MPYRDYYSPAARASRIRRGRKYYRAHPDRVLRKNQKRAMLRRAFIDSLRVGGCVDCGTKNLWVLQSDHVRGVKAHEIAAMPSHHATFAEIEAEMAKCETRCANCHQMRTAKEKRIGAAA